MSRQAVAYVAKYAKAEGRPRSVLLAMARACTKRKQPFVVQITAQELCPESGVKLRMMKYILKSLAESREIDPYNPGVGRSATTYEIICRSGAIIAPQAPDWLVTFPEGSGAMDPKESRTQHTAERMCHDGHDLPSDHVEPPF